MKLPPEGLSPEEFVEHYKQAFVKLYESDGADGWQCRTCKEPVMATPIHVSIHYTESDHCHDGSGRTRCIPLPYCEKCEGKPDLTTLPTCVHVSLLEEIHSPPVLEEVFIRSGQ